MFEIRDQCLCFFQICRRSHYETKRKLLFNWELSRDQQSLFALLLTNHFLSCSVGIYSSRSRKYLSRKYVCKRLISVYIPLLENTCKMVIWHGPAVPLCKHETLFSTLKQSYIHQQTLPDALLSLKGNNSWTATPS